MTQLEFILLNYDAVYVIVDGPNKDKKTKIDTIDISTCTITSVGGTTFPIKILRAELRTIDQITEDEGAWFFKTYWGSTKIHRGDTNEVVDASKETFMHIVKGAWYISGNLEETNRLLNTMRRYHIDVDQGIEQGYAVKK